MESLRADTYPGVADSRVRRGSEVKAAMQALARQSFDAHPEASPRDKRRLQDIIKGRYDFASIAMLIDLPPTDMPNALSDALRGEELKRMPVQSTCASEAVVAESVVDGSQNTVALQFMTEQTATRARVLRDCYAKQLAKITHAMDALSRFASRRTA